MAEGQHWHSLKLGLLYFRWELAAKQVDVQQALVKQLGGGRLLV